MLTLSLVTSINPIKESQSLFCARVYREPGSRSCHSRGWATCRQFSYYVWEDRAKKQLEKTSGRLERENLKTGKKCLKSHIPGFCRLGGVVELLF